MNIGGDNFYLIKFENGKPILKTYNGEYMTFDQKKDAFFKPVISTAAIPIKFVDNPIFNEAIGTGISEIINNVIIDNIKEK